jgi:predicted DNA-binding transcriptional regulator AlpA
VTNPVRVLTWPQVQAKGIPYSRMHADRLEKAGQFPPRLQLGANRVAWLESDIDEWLLSRKRGLPPPCGQAVEERKRKRAERAAASADAA